jgi:hypothetical protein
MNNDGIPFEYRDEKLVKELERQMEENECDASDCFRLFACHFLGLVCIIPKYNRRKFASDRLLIELQKPKRPKSLPATTTNPTENITAVPAAPLNENEFPQEKFVPL